MLKMRVPDIRGHANQLSIKHVHLGFEEIITLSESPTSRTLSGQCFSQYLPRD